MKLIKLVYEVVKFLPESERFGLGDQLRRASISILLNIAEGTGSFGDKEFKSFLRIALRSLYETVAGLKVAEEIFGVKTVEALGQANVVGKGLNALINSINKSMKANS